jgi:hypothetical protein
MIDPDGQRLTASVYIVYWCMWNVGMRGILAWGRRPRRLVDLGNDEAGVAIALGTMFTLGILATRAEPALNVLGQVPVMCTIWGRGMLVGGLSCFWGQYYLPHADGRARRRVGATISSWRVWDGARTSASSYGWFRL